MPEKAFYVCIKDSVFIDPPYNTGNDSFIYPDKFSESREEYARRVGDKDDNGYLKRDGVFQGAFRKNAKDNGHYHSNWLNMMLPRLHLAKTLLSDDGVIFISIDDNEQAQLKILCDEVFGEENFVCDFIVNSNSSKNNSKKVSISHEYILCYLKSSSNQEEWKVKKQQIEAYENKAKQLLKMNLTEDEIHQELLQLVKYPRFYDFDHYTYADVNGIYGLWDMGGVENGNLKTEILHPITGKSCAKPIGGWRYKDETLKEMLKNNQIAFGEDETIIPRVKRYLHDYTEQVPKSNVFFDSQATTKWLKSIKIPFAFPKSIELIKHILSICDNQNSLILDFFAGSGTTAHAVMQLNAEDGGNRRFICVQMPEICEENSEAAKAGFATIAEIAKERIRRAGAKIKKENPDKTIDTGFKVFKLSESHFKQWQGNLKQDSSLNAQNDGVVTARNDGLNSGSLNDTQQLDLLSNFQDVVQNGATLENMAYELALRLGFQLTDAFDFSGSIVWLDNHQKTRKTALLLASFNQELLDKILSAKPVKVFALDKIFNGNDALKVNTALQLQDAHIDFESL